MPKAASPKSRAPPPNAPTRDLSGWITHTELASRDPEATKAWCQKALGWTFKPSLSGPDGPYHLFYYADEGGGGIRGVAKGEAPGSTPTVSVPDCRAAYKAALKAGAEGVRPPEEVMPGLLAATVRAPGGVLIGLAGP